MMQTERPYLSVIVPVYNVEAYVERCVRSLLEQDFPDFELLLVDDGSRDRSGSLCDALAECDGRIRVFHKENGGVSSARNVGLDAARGEWVAFVDSDDWAKPGYLSALVDDARKCPDIDLVLQTGTDALARNNIKSEALFGACRIYSILEFPALMEDFRLYWHGHPFAKLYKRSVIEACGLRFLKGMHISEDGCFFFDFLDRARKVVFSDVRLYGYENRYESATHQNFSFHEEYYGYMQYAEGSPYMEFVAKYATTPQVRREYMSFIASRFHRAFVQIKTYADVRRVTEADWAFFEQYFEPTSRRMALDKRVAARWRTHPAVLLPYVVLGRVLRSGYIIFRRRQGRW